MEGHAPPAALAAGGALSACAAAEASVTVPLARQDRPVRWPVYKDNPAIASGLEPERGATLQIYNWVAYINTATIKSFCKKYNCHAQVTTFNTMDEAIAKLQSGQLNVDIFIPTPDVLGPLILGKLIQRLNHSYIPNRHQTWPDYASPSTTWPPSTRCPTPSTRCPTPSTRPASATGRTSSTRTRTGWPTPGRCSGTRSTTGELCEKLTAAIIDNNDFTDVPTGQTVVHHAWSGDMASSWYYLPTGVEADVLGYWYPQQGNGPVANDTMAVLRSSRSPVLAHLFINSFLDLHNALDNASYTGYQQPIEGVTPESMVKAGIMPPSLLSTTVPRSYFRKGLFELELPAKTDQEYQVAWTTFGGGL